MNYQTVSNLQFGLLLKNFFRSFQIDLGDTSVEKITFVSVGITRFVFFYVQKNLQHPFLTYVHLHKLVGESHFHLRVNIRSQLPNATCWKLLCQKLQRLLVVEWISRQLQRVWEDRLWENIWVKGTAGGRELAYGRQIGSRKRSASRVIPTKSAKQISQSGRDIFTNISH